MIMKSKADFKGLRRRDAFDMPVLNKFLTATPTAELEPIMKEYVQSDEAVRILRARRYFTLVY